MGTPDGRERMLKRHAIVVRIIEANSRTLRLESEFCGLDIERRNAERTLQAADPSDGARETLAGIEVRMKRVEQERAGLVAEKAWLDKALADFDKPKPDEPGSGRV